MAPSSSPSSASPCHGFLGLAHLAPISIAIITITSSSSSSSSSTNNNNKAHHNPPKGLGHQRCICSALPSAALTRESAETLGSFPTEQTTMTTTTVMTKTAKKSTAKKRWKEGAEVESAKKMWDQDMAFQLKSYLREGKAEEAERYMDMMRQSGIAPDLLAYNLMITIHGKANRFSQARSWFRRLESDGFWSPDAVSYRSMIGACGRAGELDEALLYYNRMKECGFQPSIQNFNTLLNLHRRAEGDAEDRKKCIRTLLSDMKEAECAPDSSTVDVIVKVYDKFGGAGSLPDAIALMEAAGWCPTEKCRMILIRAYIRCNLVDKALDEFWVLRGKRSRDLPAAKKNPSPSYYAHNRVCEIRGNGHPRDGKPDRGIGNGQHLVAGDARSRAPRLEEALCHSLICVCKAAGRYEDGIRVYEEMRESGTLPSWLTASTVIDICGRMGGEGGAQKGRALFDEARSRSPSMRESTDAGAYTATINMYLKAGLVERAAEISDMVEGHEGLILDPALFLSMLRAYSRASLHGKAVSVYKRMLKCKLTWSASMFNGVIHCCGRALPLEEIIKVFLAMVHAKTPLSSATCNLMMDIFAKAGLLEKAENVFKLAREQGVLNAISYNTIIDAYGKYKEFGKMDCALVEMQNSGFKDHVEAYNSMLDAYGKAGQVHKMENVLERMRRAHCAPDLSTFNILINVYGREGLLAELQEARREMSRAGIAPSNYTFNTLIHAYGSLEMPNEAMGAFREMQDLGLEPDAITYNCLIAAFEKSGNDLEAARWSLWMTQLGIQ